MAVLVETRVPGPAGAFAATGAWTNIAGTATVVASGATGPEYAWSLPAAAAPGTLVSLAFTSTTARRVMDAIIEVAATPTANVELFQARGTAKVVTLNLTSSGKYQLGDSAGAVLATGTAAIITGTRHRCQLDVNGTAVTGKIFTDDTGTTVLDTITGTITATAISSWRIGPTNAGASVEVSWPILAEAPADVTGRAYATGGSSGPPTSIVVSGTTWRLCAPYSRT